MKTRQKKKIEGINQQIVRCDVRIPVDLYNKIEAIAVDRGEKPHHITGRPVVTPVILDLIELGLLHYNKPQRRISDRDKLKKELLNEIKK